jgi:hypothetical protein
VKKLIHTDIEVDEKTIRIGLACGLMRFDPKEDVYVLTPLGRVWLKEYCDEEIAIVRCQAL